jgi:hypothetical protein
MKPRALLLLFSSAGHKENILGSIPISQSVVLDVAVDLSRMDGLMLISDALSRGSDVVNVTLVANGSSSNTSSRVLSDCVRHVYNSSADSVRLWDFVHVLINLLKSRDIHTSISEREARMACDLFRKRGSLSLNKASLVLSKSLTRETLNVPDLLILNHSLSAGLSSDPLGKRSEL